MQELQVLDYRTQQYRLLSLLAAVYAMHFTARAMRAMHTSMQAAMESGNFSDLSSVRSVRVAVLYLLT